MSFISLEGIDGSGKSTQARMLADHLRGGGREVVLTREPGGSEGAEAIRELVLTGEPGRWSAETEILLFTAARRDHLERTIRPALARRATVVCDRFADSTRVFQGVTRGDLTDLVDRLHDATIGTEPDRTFVIDIDPAVGLERSMGRMTGDALPESRFERFGLPFQEKARAGFRALAERRPDRIAVIDGSGTPDEVFARIRAAL